MVNPCKEWEEDGEIGWKINSNQKASAFNLGWKSARMKLQWHVRGQIRGSWVCPAHLDYFQMSDMCISRVFTWF